MRRWTRTNVLTGLIILVAALIITTPLASAETVQTEIPSIAINCTSSGQLCDPLFSTTVETTSLLKIQYFVPDIHCSSIRLHIFVDGNLVQTTGFLGWNNAPAPFDTLPLDTGLLDLGPVLPGLHTVRLQAEGQVSGCNTGQLFGWNGKLVIFASQEPSIDIGSECVLIVEPDVVVPGQAVTATVTTSGSTPDNILFDWVDPTGAIRRHAADLSTPFEDQFIPDMIGTWIVQGTCREGLVTQETLQVSFFVVPESPIGAIAMMGSSMAALGAYMFLRKSRAKPQL